MLEKSLVFTALKTAQSFPDKNLHIYCQLVILIDRPSIQFWSKLRITRIKVQTKMQS